MYIQNVAKDFVRDYYGRLYKDPSTLCELYAEESSLIHGLEGDDQGDKVPKKGETDVVGALTKEGFANAKVSITDVTATLIRDSLISVLVLGDMKVGDESSKMFVQSFVLFYDKEKGHLVLSDLLRFPQQDSESPKPAILGQAKEMPTLKPKAQNLKTPVPKRESPADSSSPEPSSFSGSSASSTSGHPSASPSGFPSKPMKPPVSSDGNSSEGSEKTGKVRKHNFTFDKIASANTFRPQNHGPPYISNPHFAPGGMPQTFSPGPTYPVMPGQFPYSVPMMPQGNMMTPMQNHLVQPVPHYRENNSPEVYRN